MSIPQRGPASRPVLGLESSCDETAAAVVLPGPPGRAAILANLVARQEHLHAPFGGVVPEIAARAHVEILDGLIAEALRRAGVGFGELGAVAATAGPGLIGGVMVGLVTGKAIAAVHELPLLGINHLEAHALSVRLTEDVAFPYVALLVSGGHTQLLLVRGPGAYRRLGTTIDDAAGEAFDKGAKLLGLPHPGGPALERAAARGQGTAFAFPRPLAGRPGADLSFSGLKTALQRMIAGLGEAAASAQADLAASYQAAIAEAIADRTGNALAAAAPERPTALVAAGGVAANAAVRARLLELAEARGLRLALPPLDLCTDNGAMIAWAGIERMAAGLAFDPDIGARVRWPLDETAPARETMAGSKGARA